MGQKGAVMQNIIKEIQSMLISQFGYPWILDENNSTLIVRMVYNVSENSVEYKMNARFIIDQDEEAVRFEILTSTPLNLLFVKEMTLNYLNMDVVCDEENGETVAKGIQTFIDKDIISNRPYAVVLYIVKPYIEAMKNALVKYRKN